MSKANTVWAIVIALLAVGAALELRLHRSPDGVSSTLAVNSLKAPATSAEIVRPSKGKLLVEDTIEPSGAATATQIADEDQFVFDRDFAAAAAKPYVETYQRQHPALKARVFVWDQSRVVFVSEPNSSIAKGYLGVFFPAGEGPGTGFTCFMVQQDADHLEPVMWGYAADLTHTIENFRRAVAESKGCSFPLL